MKIPSLPCTTKWRPHFWLGAFTAVWLMVFLVVIAPFDASDLSFRLRLLLLTPYGLLLLLAYLPAVGVQNMIYHKTEHWNVLFEAAIVLLTYALSLLLCFAYYRSDVIRGSASFIQFAGGIFLPIVFLISFLLVSGRWFISRKQQIVERIREPKMISLYGDNRTDLLRLLPEHLIYVSSAQNYVEIHYLLDGKPHKQLLRTTLSKLATQAPYLVRTHRSCLVNPKLFLRWEGTTGALIHTEEVPVSKTYRAGLEAAVELVGESHP